MMKIFLYILIPLIINYNACPKVITGLKTGKKIIALTFDACETKTPSYFDKKILSFLLEKNIPFTLFISGKFAKRNKTEIKKLSENKNIEVENHSLNHYLHMELLTESDIKNEVLKNEEILKSITGKKPVFFRFPGGFYDEKTLSIVESLGYKVVHWSFESGDPNKKLISDRLIKRVITNTKKDSILIFHINGRGYSTGDGLPYIYEDLKSKGFKFVLLKDYLK